MTTDDARAARPNVELPGAMTEAQDEALRAMIEELGPLRGKAPREELLSPYAISLLDYAGVKVPKRISATEAFEYEALFLKLNSIVEDDARRNGGTRAKIWWGIAAATLGFIIFFAVTIH
jgi:hypothetical protein